MIIVRIITNVPKLKETQKQQVKEGNVGDKISKKTILVGRKIHKSKSKRQNPNLQL
jgi:hypothetical protein